MDAWPANDRPLQRTSTRGKGKSKAKEKEKVSQQPRLETGTLTAGTLAPRGKKWEWTTIPNFETTDRLVPVDGTALKVFPTTRSAGIPDSHVPILQKAEQAACFLRSSHPDVDIPSEIIRDVVVSEARYSADLSDFDPYIGDQMASLYCHDKRRKHAFLAFPTGEVGSDLNMSEMLFRKSNGAHLVPHLRPVKQFETPIQQIATFLPFSNGFDRNPVIAVRTYASTSFFSVTLNSGSTSAASRLAVSEMACYQNSDLGGRAMVDVQLSSSPRQATLVDDQGAVYSTQMTSGIQPQLIRKSEDFAGGPEDTFWKLALSDNSGEYFLASSKNVMAMDSRELCQGTALYKIWSSQDLLTSINFINEEGLLQAATTGELLWLDRRYPGRAVLAIKHGREFDRTLQLCSAHVQNNRFSVLSSRKNDLMTIYDVSRNGSGLLHLNAPAYCHTTMGTSEAHLGYHIVQGYPELEQGQVSILQLTERRGVLQRDFSISSDICIRPQEGAKAMPRVDWPKAVKELDERTEKMRENVGVLGGRDASQVDFRSGYQRLFMNTDPEKGIRPPENADAVYDTLERMPSYLQEANSPKEHMLTTFDIAFRSGDEPRQASRADFLTQSNLSNKRGYRALMQNRIPVDSLREQVPWQSDITPFLRRFSSDIADNLQDINDRLVSLNLAMDDYRPGPSIRRETEAREQLMLDLALSTNVFSPQPFSHSRPHEPDSDPLDNVSRATEAMSLDAAELPEVQFGFLSPAFKDRYRKQDDGEPRQFATPPGVRLLLQEWDIGSDPEAYEFHDPYTSEEPAAVLPRPTGAPPPTPGTTHTGGALQSQRPPVIVASQVPPVITAKPLVNSLDLQKHPSQERIRRLPTIPNVQSQDAPAEPATQFSQEFMVSTQMVSGPYGGRQAFVKKPQKKKRLGGF